MNNDEYKKLELKINSESFNKSYKVINKVLLTFSYFGNIASIFLAYFFVCRILSSVITNEIFVEISSVFILTCVELVKRSIFDKFSLQYLKTKEFTHKDVLPLLITSICIISISFYSSISGAIEFSNKSDAIQMNSDKIIKDYSDSITKVFEIKISVIDSEVNDSKNKINLKDKEETDIQQSSQYLTPVQRSRVKDLKSEKEGIKNDIKGYTQEITQDKQELKDNISDFTKNSTNISNQNKSNNNSNSILFVLLSTLIELTILVGVYFNEYFKFRSYLEYKIKLEQDPNYQKWYLYDSILNVLYTDDTKINDRLISSKSIVELCKIKGVNVIQKDIDGFIKIIISIGILKPSGRNIKLFNKTKEMSKDILKKHFSIE